MSGILNSAQGAWTVISEWLDRTAMWISTGAADQRDTLLIAALVLAGLVLARVLLFRRAPVDVNLQQATRRPRFFGYATAVLLIGSMTMWSVFAPLASASIAC